MIMDIGPFRFYRVEKSGTLCVSIKYFDNQNWGWEYGHKDEALGATKPWLELRVWKLRIVYFEKWEKAFEIGLMGFWYIHGFEEVVENAGC